MFPSPALFTQGFLPIGYDSNINGHDTLMAVDTIAQGHADQTCNNGQLSDEDVFATTRKTTPGGTCCFS